MDKSLNVAKSRKDVAKALRHFCNQTLDELNTREELPEYFKIEVRFSKKRGGSAFTRELGSSIYGSRIKDNGHIMTYRRPGKLLKEQIVKGPICETS